MMGFWADHSLNAIDSSVSKRSGRNYTSRRTARGKMTPPWKCIAMDTIRNDWLITSTREKKQNKKPGFFYWSLTIFLAWRKWQPAGGKDRVQPRIWSVHKYSAAGSEKLSDCTIQYFQKPVVWYQVICGSTDNPLCLLLLLLPPPPPPPPLRPHCISIYFQNWFISLCLLSGSLILTLQISKIIALSLVFSSSRKPLNVLSIPLNSSLIFQHLIPPNLAFVSVTRRKLFSSVAQCLNTASPPCFLIPRRARCFAARWSRTSSIFLIILTKPFITPNNPSDVLMYSIKIGYNILRKLKCENVKCIVVVCSAGPTHPLFILTNFKNIITAPYVYFHYILLFV